jgi:hypothetical protein
MRRCANSTRMLTNRSAPIDPATTLQVLKAPVQMAQTDPVGLVQRGWTDLAALEPRAIIAKFEILQKRCTTARDAIDNALTTLEISTHIFLGKRTPASSAEVVEYLDAFKKAQIAGNAIFAPQNSYRSAIETLSTFVNGLAVMLPEKNVVKETVVKDINTGMEKANQEEEDTRKILRGLADHSSWGKERGALMAYLETIKLRVKSWAAFEADLTKWAEKCLGEWNQSDQQR